MKSFARVSSLTNIGGRADYISNPKRQENIVAQSAPVDWKPYQEFERTHQKTNKRNNEGREVMVMLPNDWADLPQYELNHRIEMLAITAAGKRTDYQWAAHWNKTYSNFHVHIIFSERTRELNPGRYTRDIYLREDGTMAQRKSERAKNPDGSFKPPVHRKGESKGEFSPKDTKYKKRSWTHNMKEALKEVFKEYGVIIDAPSLLHEYHEGKGDESAAIKQKNEIIRATNKEFDALTKELPLSQDTIDGLRKQALNALNEGKVLTMTIDCGGLLTQDISLEQYLVHSKPTRNHPKIEAPTEQQPTFNLDETIQQLLELNAEYETIKNKKRNTPIYYPEKIFGTNAAKLEEMAKVMKEQRASIHSLSKEKETLGFFQRKQKKKLDDEISKIVQQHLKNEEKLKDFGVAHYTEIEEKINELNAAHQSEIDKAQAVIGKLDSMNQRLEAIEEEMRDIAKTIPSDSLKKANEILQERLKEMLPPMMSKSVSTEDKEKDTTIEAKQHDMKEWKTMIAKEKEKRPKTNRPAEQQRNKLEHEHE